MTFVNIPRTCLNRKYSSLVERNETWSIWHKVRRTRRRWAQVASTATSRQYKFDYGVQWRYSATNTRRILLRFSIVLKSSAVISSPAVCHTLGNGDGIMCKMSTSENRVKSKLENIRASRHPARWTYHIGNRLEQSSSLTGELEEITK